MFRKEEKRGKTLPRCRNLVLWPGYKNGEHVIGRALPCISYNVLAHVLVCAAVSHFALSGHPIFIFSFSEAFCEKKTEMPRTTKQTSRVPTFVSLRGYLPFFFRMVFALS